MANVARHPLLVKRGAFVEARRLSRGQSQHALSQMVGCDQSTISSVERGDHDLTLKTATRLAIALGVTLEDLLVGGVTGPIEVSA